MPTSHHIAVSLEDSSIEPAVFGAKAATLARMRRRGLPVPPGVALPATVFLDELERVLRAHGLNVATAGAAAVAQLVSANIVVPSSVLADIERALVDLSIADQRLAVRSSAVGEDAQLSSFAGQLDSVVDVGLAELKSAIMRVWMSAFTDRALHYRRRLRLEAARSLPVGVVVQRFIEPTHAGVMFTGSPTDPTDSSLIIEAVPGRGGALVDGSLDPTRYTVRDGTVSLSGAETGALGESVLQRLIDLAPEIEDAVMAGPLDIEWAVRDEKVSVVQARPITTRAATADASAFNLMVVPIDSAHREDIPAELSKRDKFRLRLVASREVLPISKGWLIHCSRGSGATVEEAAHVVAHQVVGEDQVSVVLQRPARLHGGILRRFSALPDLAQTLTEVVELVGASETSFDLITTEVYRAHQSGIAHLSEGRLFIEIGLGAYIPKGVVPTSLYVYSETGDLLHAAPVEQDVAVYIENGAPVERSVRQVASVDAEQARALRRTTEAVVGEYGDVSVEFGVRPSGDCYLIDVIPEGIGDLGSDIRVMSPGAAAGVAVFAPTEDLMVRSLEAHFHSDRSPRSGGQPDRIVVAPRPFLALEDYLVNHHDGRLGFIFESGSLLGHLAIILREHRIPAVVVPNAREVLTEGEVVRIDTSTDQLFEVGRDDA